MSCIPNTYLQEYTGSDASATAIIQTPAFSLQGAATGNIFPMAGFSKWKTVPGSSQYKQVSFTTPNVLIGSEYISNTTLLYNGVNYRLNFIAIHANVWASSPIQVSMVFTNGLEIFHIAIPIQFDSTFSTHNENVFLKWWLYQNPEGPKPSSLSANDLLMFDGPNTSATFDLYSFCVKHDSAVNPIHKYNFCNFTTPLYINSGQLPAWLSSDASLQQMDANGFYEMNAGGPFTQTYMKSFNAIFNCMYQGTVFFNGLPDVNPISNRALFAIGGNPSGVKPSKFSVNVSYLAYKTKTSQSERQLQNVKCYPIDLASQVDDNGNIYIDESTKKPIDMSNLTSTPVMTNTTADQVAFQNKVIYWTIFTIIGIIALVIIVAFVIWMFTTKETGVPPDVADLMKASSGSGSTAPPPPPPATMAVAAAAVVASANVKVASPAKQAQPPLPDNPFNLFNNKVAPAAAPAAPAAASLTASPASASANVKVASPAKQAQPPLPDNPFNLFNNKVAPAATPAASLTASPASAKGLNAKLNAGITPRYSQRTASNSAKMENTLTRVPLLRQTAQVNTSSIHQ